MLGALGAGASLRGVGTAAATAIPERDADGTALTTTVATQNLGLGAGFLSIASDDSDASIPERVGSLYNTVRASEPHARLAALADELARASPTILGVQEAAVVRRGPRSGGAPTDPDAESVVFDFLAILREALADRGTPYRLIATTTNVDLELPARADGNRIDVRLTDRDALLVRGDADVEVESAAAATYDASVTLPIGGDRTVEIERGYARADLRFEGASVTVLSTHLASGLKSVRTEQARELAETVESLSGPLVVLGDLNDPPDAAVPTATPDGNESTDAGAYGVLTGTLTDAARAAGVTGGTCCRPSSLRPPDEDGLTQRIDHVLVRGVRATSAERFAVEPTESASDGSGLFPSDHAGVLVGVTSAPATPSTADPSESPVTDEDTGGTRGIATGDDGGATVGGATGDSTTDADPGTTTATGTPGFGPLSALVAVVGLSVASIRRLGRD
ncbi:MAG: endonuclease/exonuclease/phosphatase family protein [Halobellus sp.]|uniref:endonuclease/exonuclease/phosphatase family protein n=1 Tax=Halobellus sp. TaxID=1979212 RepID=UPI0035D4608C